MGYTKSEKSKIDKNEFKHTQTIIKTNLYDIRYYPGTYQVDLLTPLSGAPEGPSQGPSQGPKFLSKFQTSFGDSWGYTKPKKSKIGKNRFKHTQTIIKTNL